MTDKHFSFRYLLILSLISLIPALLTRLYWHFQPASWLATAGGFFAVLGITIPLISLYVFLKSEHPASHRFQQLLFLSALTGISICVCGNLLSSFSGHNPRVQKVVILKNTSEQTLHGLKLFWGGQDTALPTLGPRTTRELVLSAPGEIEAQIVFKAPDGLERRAQILVGPENKRIQVLIDWGLNVFAEVQ